MIGRINTGHWNSLKFRESERILDKEKYQLSLKFRELQ